MRMALIPLLILASGAAQAHELDARQKRALDCAAIFYAGATELERAGRIDTSTARLVQNVAKGFRDQLPGSRRVRTEAVNARITEMSKGKTREQLLLDFNKRRQPCEDEFL